jgi:hypothetical protein
MPWPFVFLAVVLSMRSEGASMFTKTPMVPNSDESKKQEPAKAPAKTAPAHGAPQKGGAVDHKAAIEKMHPEHLHRLVQDAHAGKFGQQAQQTAQQAMQGAPAQQGAPGQEAPEAGKPNYASMFSGAGANDGDEDDQPVTGGQMFGGR